MPDEVTPNGDLKAGDFYEDAFYHPCLCFYVNFDDDEVRGVSLIDGSWPRSASIAHGFVRKLSLAEVAHYKFFGPLDATLEGDQDWTSLITRDDTVSEFDLDSKD